jgi:transcriptional regulator with GAF, ATPase, and Fis domain
VGPAAARPAPGPARPELGAVERDYILTVLQETNWVITGPRGAAKVLGLHPNTLRNRIKKLGLTRSAP